jgi:hypothetical protein
MLRSNARYQFVRPRQRQRPARRNRKAQEETSKLGSIVYRPHREDDVAYERDGRAKEDDWPSKTDRVRGDAVDEGGDELKCVPSGGDEVDLGDRVLAGGFQPQVHVFAYGVGS